MRASVRLVQRHEQGLALGQRRAGEDKGTPMTRIVPEPDLVRSQLHRVLSSPAFDASERNCRFLEYVVDEALAGRTDRLKAYTIATTVFGRDSKFDAQNDPVVRIEARRLRRSLEHYYLTDGKSDDLVISIPKGGYAPLFQTNEAKQSVASSETERVRPEIDLEPNGLSPSGPVIYVASFEEEGDQSEFPNFTHGFTRALIVALTRFNDLAVYGTETSLSYGPERLVWTGCAPISELISWSRAVPQSRPNGSTLRFC